jgi:hypothetical protein
MSAADKYARPVESVSAESLAQAKSAGQALADKGVTHQASLGTGAPAPTPAMKYGGASDNLERQLPPPSRSR